MGMIDKIFDAEEGEYDATVSSALALERIAIALDRIADALEAPLREAEDTAAVISAINEELGRGVRETEPIAHLRRGVETPIIEDEARNDKGERVMRAVPRVGGPRC